MIFPISSNKLLPDFSLKTVVFFLFFIKMALKMCKRPLYEVSQVLLYISLGWLKFWNVAKVLASSSLYLLILAPEIWNQKISDLSLLTWKSPKILSRIFLNCCLVQALIETGLVWLSIQKLANRAFSSEISLL